MPFTSNGYYNNPAIGQMAGSLASMFAPPTPQEMLTAQTIAQQNAANAKKQAIVDSLPKSVADVYTLMQDPDKMAKFKQYQIADSGAPLIAQEPYAYVTKTAGDMFTGKAMDAQSAGTTRILPYGFAPPGAAAAPAASVASDNSDDNSDTAKPAAAVVAPTPHVPGTPYDSVMITNPAADSTKQISTDQLGAKLEEAALSDPNNAAANAAWQAHLKANPRNTGQNININGNPNGIEDGYNKAIGTQLGKVVDAGEETGSTRALYDQLLAASEAGGDKITTGPMAQYALKAKQFVGNVLGTPLDGVPEAELMNNIGTTIAAKATRAMSQRGGTQFEFIKQLEAKPGFMQSRPGMEAIIKVAKQGLDDTDNLNGLAADPYNRAHWPQIVKNYYATHPVMSPFTPGQAFGQSDIDQINKIQPPPAANTTGATLTPLNANGGSHPPIAVHSEAELNALPSGATWAAPDGTVRVKP